MSGVTIEQQGSCVERRSLEKRTSVEWQLHFSTQPVAALELVPGDSLQVAVWDRKRNVYFYDQRTGMPLGQRELVWQDAPVAPGSAEWDDFVAGLRAPNGGFLPTVHLSGMTIHTSRDGHLRLVHFSDGRLELEVDGRNIALDREQDGRFLAVGLDRALGLIGAITEQGRLCLFQQHVRVGSFWPGFTLGVDSRLSVLVPDALGRLVISNGERMMVVDAGGQVQRELSLHFTAGPMAVSPNGQFIALADADDNVIRIYDADLNPTHQRHAIDLIAQARQVQLLASSPGRRASVAALDVSDDGAVVFALGGVVCATRLAALNVLPQPRPLF